jgi:hypothetical protein
MLRKAASSLVSRDALPTKGLSIMTDSFGPSPPFDFDDSSGVPLRVPAETNCPACGLQVQRLIPISGGFELHHCAGGCIITVLGEDGESCTLGWSAARASTRGT